MSIHRPPSGTCLPSLPSRLRLEAEEREVKVLELEPEVAPEEEVKVEYHRVFYRSCRWINPPFTNIRVLSEREVAVTEAASE